MMHMKKLTNLFSYAILLLIVASCNNPSSRQEEQSDTSEIIQPEKVTKRVGMVVKIKEDQIEEYKRLHAPDNPGVRDLLTRYNMRNFSIFLQKLDDGNYYEFGYYEYVGDNFEEDMEKLAAEPRNIEWLKVCDPMQIPLEGYEGWAEMELVYYNP
jgi:L-rhamnose mutarotase